MPTVTLTLYCSGCLDERLFGQADCGDGHLGDCPDWICLDCGGGVVAGPAWATSADPD